MNTQRTPTIEDWRQHLQSIHAPDFQIFEAIKILDEFRTNVVAPGLEIGAMDVLHAPVANSE